MQTNKERLWARLMEMANIGAAGETGSRRLALSHEDLQGRELFSRWCETINMTVSFDQVGNLFATKIGTTPDLAPVVMGSHLDTQPNGGRFDGVFGVLAALEVMETLHEKGIHLARTVQIAVWTNEEGARFSPAMLGSSVYAGLLELKKALAIKDKDSISIKTALSNLKLTEPVPPKIYPYAYLEAHIEQGPVLENANKAIGVVTGGQGLAWLDIQVKGFSAHAGTTPMTMRKDALFTAAEIWTKLEKMAAEYNNANVTIGQVRVENSSYNTIIGNLYFSLDLRHADLAVLEEIIEQSKETIKSCCQDRGLQFDIKLNSLSPPQPFNSDCVSLIGGKADELGYTKEIMISGAGHDAILLAKVCPTAMIFIPSQNGISHNPEEYSSPEEVHKGANVLLETCKALSNDKTSRF